ncbi:MAG: solute carrier family 26 protein [Myxococcales bacterium]|nr:solute carrier family 26 protein [Myxococcales bacterium]
MHKPSVRPHPALRWLPFSWLRSYRRTDLRPDVAAGLTTAVMLIPQGMGYAMLAGLPPIVGLYAALIPPIAYAATGRSRQLSVGPVAMDSLLVAVSLGALAAPESDAYVALAAMLAVLVGGLQWLMGALGIGFVVNFLSRPVISGFTSAAALIIGGSQLTHMLQVPLPRTHHVHRIVAEALAQLGSWSWLSLAIGAGSVVSLLLLRRLRPAFPRALFVIAAATLITALAGWAEGGLGIVGEVPAGLPRLMLPKVDPQDALTLLPAALTIALVSFLETISVGKRLARGEGDEVDANAELRAIGAANLGGGLFGGYPVAGGLSRSAVNDAAGARSQLSGLITAAAVGITLVFFTPLFHDMPKAALAAVIMTAVFGLIDLAEPRRLFRVKRQDFFLLVLSFVATLSFGIQQGIAVGVGASMLLFIVLTTRPHVAVLGRIPGTEAYLNVERHPHAETLPGVLIVRLDAQFYFGNVTFLRQTLKRLEAEREIPLKAIVLDFSGVNQLDSSAESALCELDRAYASRGVRLLLSRVKGPVRDVLFRSELLERLDADHRVFFRTHDAVQAAAGSERLPSQPPSPDPRAPADRIGCGRFEPGHDESDQTPARLAAGSRTSHGR